MPRNLVERQYGVQKRFPFVNINIGSITWDLPRVKVDEHNIS